MFGYLRDILLAILALKVSQSDMFIRFVKYIISNSYSLISARLPTSLLENLSTAFNSLPCVFGYYINELHLPFILSTLFYGYVFRMILRQLPFGGK